MKIRSLVAVVAVLSFALVPLSVSAQGLIWDPDGATVGTSVSGNWDKVTANWTFTPDSGANTTWSDGGSASFVVDANYTVTLTEPITLASLSVSGTNGTLTIAGSSANSLTLGSSAIFDITGSRTVNVSAPLGGIVDLTKSGNGTLTLSGANTYSGGTIISTGSGSIGIGVDTVSSGGVITSGPLGTGPITVSTAGHKFFASGGPRAVENPVVLNAGVTTTGSEVLTFRGGDWQVVGGTRILTVSSTAPTVLESKLTDDAVARTFQKAGTGALVMRTGDTISFLGGITASAGTLLAGSGTPFPTNNNNTITINASTLDLNGFDVRLSRLAGNATGSVLLGTNTLTAGNNASSSTFSGVISGTGGYVKVGTVSQVLNGTNTFTGGILIAQGPVYFPTNGLGSPYSLGPGPNVITITNVGSWGANVVGTSIITNQVLLATVGPLALLDPAGASNVVWVQAGQITGTGGILRTTKGSGVPIFTGDNTFSGGVQMDARSLMLGHKNALGTGALVIGNPTNPPGNLIELASVVNLVGADAVPNATTINQGFSLNTTNGIPTDFGLELSGPVTLSSGTKTIGASGAGLVKLSGVISGSGGINKDGAGTLTLAAANGYSGSTAVTGGTLALTGGGSVAGSSDITVLEGGTLDASGRTDGTLTVGAGQRLAGLGLIKGNVTVAGVLAPGSMTGTLTINGNLSLNSGARFEIDKAESPATDLLSVSGTISGTLTVTNAGAALLAAGDSFTLFNKGVSGFTTVSLPPGYSWDNQLATSGSISVLAVTFLTTPSPTITNSVSGGNLTMNWPANYAGGWVLETSPDLVTWTTVEGSRDVSSMSFPINPAEPTVFYRLRLLTL